MILHVYERETMNVVAKINGDNNDDCESIAFEKYGDTDIYAWTYAPAFELESGCIDNGDAEEINA